MINNYDNLPQRRNSLKECLEILQTSMLNELNGWEDKLKSLSSIPDINDKDFFSSRESYKQKLEDYRKIYPEAKWILIFNWFDVFENVSPKNNKLRGIINDMPIQEVVKSLRRNKAPNIKPESVGRQSISTDSGKSESVSYSLASLLEPNKLREFMPYSDINIPSSVVIEWSNGIKDGSAAITWWNSLTDQQKNILSGDAIDFLLQQKIKQSRSRDNNYVLELIENQRRLDSLEFNIDKSSTTAQLKGDIDRDSFGVKGFCFSQSDDFVKEVLLSEDLKIYSNDNWESKYGQRTVDLVRIALNAIPDIEAIQTDPNSMADVGLRWDMILIFKRIYFFPIQIKSSADGVKQALEESNLGNYAYKQMSRIEDIIEKAESNHADKIERFNNVNRQKILEKALEEKVLRLSKKSEKYRWSMPLYIWTEQKTQNISYLIQLFVNTFKINVDVQSISVAAINEYIETDEKLIEQKIIQQKIKERAEIRKEYLKMNRPEEKIKRWRENNLQISKQVIEHLENQIRVRTSSHLPKTRQCDEVLDLLSIIIKELKIVVDSYSINVNEFNANKYKRNLFINPCNEYDSDEEILSKSTISCNFKRIMEIDNIFFKSRITETEKIAQLLNKLTGFLNGAMSDMDDLEINI
jgi:hypothetical protein